MDLIAAIKTRRSIRAFKRGEIPEEEIRELIELGNYAPSAGNLQARDFIVVKDEKTKDKLCEAALNQWFIADAPVVMVVCANLKRIAPYGERGKTLYCIQDASAAVQNILLAVHSKGYGACWVGAFDEKEASKILNLPAHIRPVAIIPIGVPAEKPITPTHRDIEELIHYEKW